MSQNYTDLGLGQYLMPILQCHKQYLHNRKGRHYRRSNTLDLDLSLLPKCYCTALICRTNRL